MPSLVSGPRRGPRGPGPPPFGRATRCTSATDRVVRHGACAPASPRCYVLNLLLLLVRIIYRTLDPLADARWFNAYAGWAPGQLLMEAKRGVWFTAAASPKVILQDVEPGEGPQYWHKIMRMLGGELFACVRFVAGHAVK